MNTVQQKNSGAFSAAAWAALFIGGLAYLIGLWNATMQLNEKGYYFTLLLFGLFGAVSLQKSVRDRLEGIPVTNIYYGLSWVSVIAAIVLLTVGLWNASLALSEKGFYGMAFVLSLFAAIVVQKNTRDAEISQRERRHIHDALVDQPEEASL
ncbi:MAG: inner membrane protein YiaA [Caldilineaceae bacterium]